MGIIERVAADGEGWPPEYRETAARLAPESVLRPGRPRAYPAPTVPEPDQLEELEATIMGDENATATDGCDVEPDGTCEHGHPSWLLRWGLI